MVKFAYFGVNLGLQWDDPSLTQQFEELVLPIWKPDPDLEPVALFRAVRSAQGELVLDGPDDELAEHYRQDFFESLERRMHFYLANHCREVVFVHAGAVAHNGGVILVPGSSYSGKSTLVQELVAAGAAYLSDEYAVIDRAGQVHPFPRPISLRQPGGAQRISPARVQLSCLPVCAVLATHYQAGEIWEPERLSAGRGVMELLAHTVTARVEPALAMSCLSACTRDAICWSGVRGDAGETARTVLNKLSSR